MGEADPDLKDIDAHQAQPSGSRIGELTAMANDRQLTVEEEIIQPGN